MAISEPDLKLLWGRAAGRCSICKVRVTEDKQSITEAFPFGENAHIISAKPNGPRGKDTIVESLRNNYFNLILLCPNCHTKIDKSPEDYPVEKLHQIKRVHESEMNDLHPSDKASYDQFLQFSRVTEENWLSPDRQKYVPFGVTREEWAAAFLEPYLDPALPKDVIKLFEVARGCMIYSWFFYPLATLAFEQLTRVGEFAIRERCRILTQAPSDFTTNLRRLVEAGLISAIDERRWQAIGNLSQDRSHLTGFMLIDPGQALSFLRNTADLINALFWSLNKNAK
jgi:HNH endonuclease